MWVRRLIPALSVCLAASVTTAVAQPKGAPKKGPVAPAKAPVAPAKDPAPAPAGTPAPTGTPTPAPGDAGAEVQMTEDAPPGDLEGREENPDAPKIPGGEDPGLAIKKPAPIQRSGYPIEEAMRPITLPKNLVEISLDPHTQVSDVMGATALRARYGITNQVQLGLAYMIGGIYKDPSTGFHAGKAVGIDVTVLLKDWIGVRLGVPVYIDPLAVGITLGAPMKWQLAEGKFALGAFDDLLAIKVKRFVPSFYQEALNDAAAEGTRPMGTNTVQSNGQLRFTAYGVMQHQPNLAFIGRIGVIVDDFSTTKTSAGGGLTSIIRAGLQYTPRKYLDLGFSIGFDDLSKAGSFGPAGLLAFRI